MARKDLNGHIVTCLKAFFNIKFLIDWNIMIRFLHGICFKIWLPLWRLNINNLIRRHKISNMGGTKHGPSTHICINKLTHGLVVVFGEVESCIILWNKVLIVSDVPCAWHVIENMFEVSINCSPFILTHNIIFKLICLFIFICCFHYVLPFACYIFKLVLRINNILGLQ
jgi:hypothetical protein